MLDMPHAGLTDLDLGRHRGGRWRGGGGRWWGGGYGRRIDYVPMQPLYVQMPPPPPPCPSIFQPVQGVDGQVYDNICFAHRAGTQVAKPLTAKQAAKLRGLSDFVSFGQLTPQQAADVIQPRIAVQEEVFAPPPPPPPTSEPTREQATFTTRQAAPSPTTCPVCEPPKRWPWFLAILGGTAIGVGIGAAAWGSRKL